MDSSLRNTADLRSNKQTTKPCTRKSLILISDRIDQLQNALARRFENLIGLATIQRGDRADAAVRQYSMKTETAGLVCFDITCRERLSLKLLIV